MIDPLSLCCLKIEVWGTKFENYKELPDCLGTATGFLVAKNSETFLVTNLHVVTGINPLTGQPLSKNGQLPEQLLVHFLGKIKNGSIKWHKVGIPLVNSPWIQHPGDKVDVVAIPLNDLDISKEHTLDLSLTETDILPRPAMPISVIGFPFGISGGGMLPIWLTGYMASEYFVDIDNNPVFFVNVSGRGGLSGAPVILRTNGPYQNSKRDLTLSSNNVTKFLGIYSGRVHEQSDVCRVWKTSVLKELLNIADSRKSENFDSVTTDSSC